MKFIDLLDRWLEFRREDRKCKSCIVLENQLFVANNDREKLLDQILELTQPKKEPVIINEEVKHEPIRPAKTPWGVRRQLLEQEDRAKAEIIRKRNEAFGEIAKTVTAVGANKPVDIRQANNELEEELRKIAEKHDAELADAESSR